jgi:Flp pilus assembly protein TadG
MAALHIWRRSDRSQKSQTNKARRQARRRFGLRGLSRSDRGVAAVEAAIITPIFFLLVIGVIEFGLAFKDQLSITSAVRAGARIASAEPRIATFADDAASQVAREGSAIDMSEVQELWVYQADSTGHPMNAGGGFASCTTNCVHFTWSGSAFVESSGSWPSTSQNACQGSQDSVGVYLLFKHPGVTHAFFDYLGLHSYTVMRLEPIPALQGGGCK